MHIATPASPKKAPKIKLFEDISILERRNTLIFLFFIELIYGIVKDRKINL